MVLLLVVLYVWFFCWIEQGTLAVQILSNSSFYLESSKPRNFYSFFTKRLFQMINDLLTIFEVETGNAKQFKDQSGTNNNSKSKSSDLKKQARQPPKVSKMSSPPPEEEDESEDKDEDGDQGAVFGACGDNNYSTYEFWICCDACEKWFHGKCVKITPEKAEHIKHYKCPSCSNKRARP